MRCCPSKRMNILFAMDVTTTTDDQGYLLWIAHSWGVFVPLLIALFVALSFWMSRRIRRSSSTPPRAPDLPIAPFQETNKENPPRTVSDSDPQSSSHWALPVQAVT